MKKKLLAAAIGATAVSVSTGAFAQTSSTANTDYPVVTTGGTVVFEDQHVQAAAAEIDAGAKIVLALPAGANFSGTPTASATGPTIKLKANSLGDPGLDGLVTLTDTNGDGSSDRAEVGVAVASSGSTDVVTFKGSMTYSGTSTTGNLTASVFVQNKAGTFLLTDTDNVLATKGTSTTAASPLAQRTSTAGITLPNSTNAAGAIFPTASTLLITVPSGVGGTNNNTITLTLGSGLKADTATTYTVTALTDGAPTLTATAATDGASTITLTLGAATTRISQYSVAINRLDTTALASPATVSATASGNAGITGSVVVANLSAAGITTTASTQTVIDAVKVVRSAANLSGGLAPVTFAEIFDGDFKNPGTGTFTLTPPTGITLGGTPAVTVTGGGVTATAALASNVVTVTITGDTGVTASSLKIDGLTAKAASTYAGTTIPLTIANGTTTAGVTAGTVNVGTVINPGAATVAGPTTVSKVGAPATGKTANITITETTYGGLRVGSLSDITVTAPTGITITNVAMSTTDTSPGSATGVDPTNGLTLTENGTGVAVGGGSWSGVLATESNSTVAAGGVITLGVTYNVASTVAVGTDVNFTVSGAAGASGTAKLATVAAATSTTIGTIPTVVPGATTFKSVAPITITESFADSLTFTAGRVFRIVAPTGVVFDATAATVTITGDTATATTAVATTFAANDTLVVTTGGAASTGTAASIALTPKVTVATGQSGLLSFSIVDGDAAGAAATKLGLVGSSQNLIYAGTIETLDAGAAQSVNVGYTATNAITGGVAPYTVATSSATVATAEVSGSNVTVTGAAAGTSTLTITDALGNTDTFVVTVAQGAAEPDFQANSVVVHGGGTSTASFTAGGTKDSGTTFESSFTTADEVKIVGTITPDAADVGTNGSLFVVVRSQSTTQDTWSFLTPEGFKPWPTGKVSDLESYQDVTPLAASHSVDVFSGNLAVGTHKVFLGYMKTGGSLVYTSVPITLTVE